MKSTAVAATIAVLATLLATGANAQTGRPSVVEVPSASDTPHLVAADEAGSYARYLMLNGATRDEALVAARNIDHPAPRKVVASRTPARTDAQGPASR